MEDIIYYNELYDLYGSLLTEKQKKYFEDYYCQNYSFQEISENYKISRNAAFKQVHAVINKLQEYEDNLKLLDKRNKLLSLLHKIEDNSLREKIEEIIL